MIIPVGIAASGLDIFTKFGGILADPLSISYEILDPGGVVRASGTGFQRSTGHYDARDSIIPDGFDISLPWTIDWTFVSPASVSGTASESFTVVDNLTSSFTNVDDIIEQIKLDLGLTDTEFTQAQFEVFIVKILNKINRRLCLEGDEELSLSESGEIEPELNGAGKDLILIGVECLVQKRKRIVAIGKGIRVKDGDSEIDTTAGFSGQKDLVDSLCGDFEKAIIELIYRGCSIFADMDGAVSGEIVWYGNSRILANMDHDGEGSGVTRDFSSPFDPSSMEWSFPNRG